MSDLVFAEKSQDSSPRGTWKALIVDDDPGIHVITRTVLRDLIYEDRNIEFISAYSRAEAEVLLRESENIALILLDVVMEEDDSGLKLVEFIREDIKNPLTRIILRTGQPGKAPSQQVIIDFDINDYEEKTDLTAQKLYTTVIASLRNFRDLQSLDSTRTILERHRSGLSKIGRASGALFEALSPRELVIGVYNQLRSLIHRENENDFSSFAALQENGEFGILIADGRYAGLEGTDPEELIGESSREALENLKRENRNLLIQDGVIHLYEDASQFRFLLHVSEMTNLETQDRQLLDIFASNVSVAYENLLLNREIVGTQEELITRLSEVVETRSHDTAQHVRRVGEFCELIGSKLGMDEDAVHGLKMASTMHDIGKVGIPDEILLKPDFLTEQEFSVVKTHTGIGYAILKDSSRPFLQAAALICLQHHERYDGKGYPAGLQGDDIHINARIVSICDVFDSVTHGRLHREPWSTAKAVEYLKSERGQSFDSDLVDILIENIDSAVQINSSYPD